MKWLVLALVVAAVAAEFAEEELEDDEQDRLFPFLHKMVRGRKRQAPRTTNIMGSYQKVRLSPKTRDAVCMGGEMNKQYGNKQHNYHQYNGKQLHNCHQHH